MKGKNLNPICDKERKDIPIIEIADPYVYVTSTKVIAYLSIIGESGKQERIYSLVRMKKKGKYMMQ